MALPTNPECMRYASRLSGRHSRNQSGMRTLIIVAGSLIAMPGVAVFVLHRKS